ncbi:MAG TPA: DUF4430 domain-containing protein [Puia sp.]|nr:DUF4430 domain-containing protein [Puia sp.]
MVALEITNGPHFQIEWTDQMNVQHALERAYRAAPAGTFTYSLQYYGARLGYLVNMINETYETFNSKDAPFYFWEFLLNGRIATTGIDHSFLKDGDTVTFDFLPYTTTTPGTSTVQKKFRSKS